MRLGATAVVIHFLGTFACADGADGAAESGARRPPPIGACLDAYEVMQVAGSARFEGQVEEVGLGMPNPTRTRDCPLGGALRFGPPGLGDASLLAQVSWLRVRDAEFSAPECKPCAAA